LSTSSAAASPYRTNRRPHHLLPYAPNQRRSNSRPLLRQLSGNNHPHANRRTPASIARQTLSSSHQRAAHSQRKNVRRYERGRRQMVVSRQQNRRQDEERFAGPPGANSTTRKIAPAAIITPNAAPKGTPQITLRIASTPPAKAHLQRATRAHPAVVVSRRGRSSAAQPRLGGPMHRRATRNSSAPCPITRRKIASATMRRPVLSMPMSLSLFACGALRRL
jgi:hypothetical protein